MTELPAHPMHCASRPPEAELRRFDGYSGLRQWLAFPSSQWTSLGLARHERRSFLIEFGCGPVAFLRLPLDFRWTDERMQTAAGIFTDLARSVETDLSLAALQLGDALDAPIELVTPVLAASNLEHWEPRRLALHYVTLEALARHPSIANAQGADSLTDRVERLVEQLRAQLAVAIEAFRSGLCPDAVRHAMSPNGLRLHAYNKLAGSFGIAKRNRIQFAETFPIFMQGLLDESPPFFAPASYFDAIDRGEPAIPNLASNLAVRPATIRFLVGKSPDQIGRHWVKAPGRLAALLDTLPQELRPQDASGWSDFNEIVRSLTGGALPEVSALLLRAWFAERCRRLPHVIGSPSELRVDPAVARDIGDLYSGLKRCVRTRAAIEFGLPEPQCGPRARELADSALKGRSWSTLAALARDWRDCVHSFPLASKPQCQRSRLRRFPALLPSAWPIHDVVLVCLDTDCALEEEAKAMHHCVDSYIDDCELSESFIVSVRNATSGLRLSTAEFSLVRDPTGPIRLLLRQHVAARNAPPSAAAVEAVAMFQRASHNQRLQTHWARILRARACSRIFESEDETRLEHIAAEEAAFRATLKPAGAYDRLLQRMNALAATPRSDRQGLRREAT